MTSIVSTRPEPKHKGAALFSPEFLENPYPDYAEMRAQSPVIWLEGMNAWLVTGYDAVAQAFLEPRLRVNFAEYQINRNGPGVVDEYYYKQFQSSIVANDPPRHTRIRSIFRDATTRSRISDISHNIQIFCDRFIDQIKMQAEQSGKQESEIVENYSNRVPQAMISSVLGVPETDRPKIADFVARYAPTAEAMPLDRQQLDDVNAAAQGLDAYFGDLIAKRTIEPREDFISEVLALNSRADEENKLTDEELRTNFIILYTGGQDTQEKMFTNMLLALSRHPKAFERLASNPELVDDYIGELYRYDSAGQFMGRTATEDVEIGGITIPKGDTVVISWAAANRDPAHFERPDELILERKFVKGASNHLTFGIGRHACIGVNLAHANMPLMLKTFLGEFGAVTLDMARSQRHHSIATRGFDSMYFSWK